MTLRTAAPFLIAVFLFLPACVAPQGSKTTISSSCQTGDRRHGACRVNFGIMEDHYRLELEHPNFAYYKTNIKLSARLSVAKGVVKVWFHNDGDAPREVIVRPGKPAEITGIAHVYSLSGKNTIDLYFQVIDPHENGRAENIEAEIDYLM